jgi:hypothetical protein
MVIEVKTSLGRKDTGAAIENIISAKRLNERIEGIIFAFKSPRVGTVMRNLEACSRLVDSEQLPRAILLLDKRIIIHNWGWARERRVNARSPYSDENIQRPYSVRFAKKDKGAVVVAFLLLLFSKSCRSEEGLKANFINALNDILDKHTEPIPISSASTDDHNDVPYEEVGHA